MTVKGTIVQFVETNFRSRVNRRIRSMGTITENVARMTAKGAKTACVLFVERHLLVG